MMEDDEAVPLFSRKANDSIGLNSSGIVDLALKIETKTPQSRKSSPHGFK